MKKAIALILGIIVGGGLMIYSASRTVDLLQMTLPASQKDLAYLALLAFDGGLVAWALMFMFGAEGAYQRAISLLLAIVSLIGVVVGFGADQILGAVSGGVVRAENIGADFGLTVVIATVAIIALHIAGIVFFHLLSPENRRRMQLEHFNDQIEDAAMKKSSESIAHLASSLAEQITASRMAQLNAVFQLRIARDPMMLPQPTNERKNGHEIKPPGVKVMESSGEASDVEAPKAIRR